MEAFNREGIFDTKLALQAMYRSGGIRNLLLYLKDLVQTQIDIVRITAVLCSQDAKNLISLADTNAVSVSNIHTVGDNASPLVFSERLHDSFFINDLSPLQDSVRQTELVWPERPFLHHKSMLRIPCVKNESYVFIICFWSDTAGVFSNRHIEELTSLLSPLLDDIRERLPDIENYQNSFDTCISHERQVCLTAGLNSEYELARNMAPCDLPVLILGETGVGKESFADTIHHYSNRRDKPFIKINCSAIPDTLIDSELFGHEKGAFTGAQSAHQGYFEQADGGTLFLDEIGEMRIDTQVRLLRVLDTGIVRRVGSGREHKVDVRIIAATHEDILKKVVDGEFRHDLWFRLSVLPLRIPPLRKRPQDIPVLVQYFIEMNASSVGLTWKPSITASEMNRLMEYSWPGNVRELEHTVQRSLVSARMHNSSVLRFVIERLPQKGPHETVRPGHPTPPIGKADSGREWLSLREYENKYILEVVKHCDGKLTGPGSATEILGMHYATLRNRLKELRKAMNND